MSDYREIGPIVLKGMPTPVNLSTAVAGQEEFAVKGAERQSG